MKKMENWVFKYKPRLHFQIFPNTLRSMEVWIFEVSLISYLVQLWGKSSTVCLYEIGEPNL